MNSLLGKKLSQSQMFLENGTRIPVTQIQVGGNVVIGIKTEDKDKYSAVQLGFGIRKNPTKALVGIAKKANLKSAPRFLREVRFTDLDSSIPPLGTIVNPTEIFKPGDVVDVIGISKGKGYAGVVKRHHFKGGPRTHGQSDRERAPGSIGQTTTPGRVYKGKRMAGRMGHGRVTIQNLEIVDVNQDKMFIKGLVPGSINSLVMIRKVGEDKKFVPLFKEETKETAETKGTGSQKEETKDAKS